MINGFYFILDQDVGEHFEINCTYVMSLVYKDPAILEINK